MFSFNEPGHLLRSIERAAIEGSDSLPWKMDFPRIHRRIAAAECRAFFDSCTLERGFGRVNSSLVDQMIVNLLLEHSVSNAFRVILGGARWASDFQAKQRVSGAHAGNYMISACQRWSDKARSSNWKVTGLGRPFRLTRSIFSALFYDQFSHLGNRGLVEKDSDLWGP